MHTYAIGFFIAAVGSACFVDSGVQQNVARLGKLSLGTFAALGISFEVASHFA